MSKSGGGRLTTHVLDTASGKPVAGLKIALYRVSGNSHKKLKDVVTNADGRCDAPLLEGSDFRTGQYELVFFAGDYLRASGVRLPDPAFLDDHLLDHPPADQRRPQHRRVLPLRHTMLDEERSPLFGQHFGETVTWRGFRVHGLTATIQCFGSCDYGFNRPRTPANVGIG